MATVVMHASCYFNWQDSDISGTSADRRFLPALLRGDQYNNSVGTATYGLPSWWFLKQSREWTQVKALYEEIKPVKQYFTIRIVGATSEIASTLGVTNGKPVDGNEYWKFMVNSDFLAPRNIDSDSGIWQDKRVDTLIRDSSTKFTWIQPAAFGTVGGGMGQSRPPAVSITNAWPASTQYVRSDSIDSALLTTSTPQAVNVCPWYVTRLGVHAPAEFMREGDSTYPNVIVYKNLAVEVLVTTIVACKDPQL